MRESFNPGSEFQRPIRMLFAGGCHVVGYPVGAENSFATLVQERLRETGIETEIRRLSHLKITHHSRLFTAIEEARPDVLVLQLGHFELSRSLSDYFRQSSGSGKKSSSSGPSNGAAAAVANAPLFYLRALFKSVIDRLLGHSVVDLPKFHRELDALAGVLGAMRIPRIVILTPLGCAEPMTRYYRRRSLPFWQEAAGRCGAELLDVFSPAPQGLQRHFGIPYYYYDSIHLGVAGHHAVARVLFEHLHRVFTQCRFEQTVG